MDYHSNKYLTQNARKLRRNMTKQERKLWYDYLRELPIPFHRQYVIDQYVVDFCCESARLIIELDGSQHYEDEGLAKDRERDGKLRALGYTILRYSDRDINENFKGVCEDISLHLAR